jgi:ATP-dependent Clp protease protease subunit
MIWTTNIKALARYNSNENSYLLNETFLYKPNFHPIQDSDAGVVYVTINMSGSVDEMMNEAFLNIEADFFSQPNLHCFVSEIRIIFSCDGGIVPKGFEIIDFITEWNATKGVKISFICTGLNASMAIPIIACGYNVYATENAKFLIHDISSGTNGKVHDMKNVIEYFEMLKTDIIKVLKKNTKLSTQKLKGMMDKEHYFDAKTAVQYGLVDEIITY